MPAEWKKQEAVILAWPHNLDTWPFQLEGVRRAYAQIVREIADHQKVWLLVNNGGEEISARNFLTLHAAMNEGVHFYHIPTHDAWVRDYGPIYVTDGLRRRLTSWVFNGWGDKYDSGYRDDSTVPKKIAKLMGEDLVSVDCVLEGGSIDVNGKGSLLTTKTCLLNSNRQTGRTQGQIEGLLKKFLGVSHVVWLEGEIAGDDTDGHIDDAVRFVSEDTVVCVDEKNQNDANFFAIQKMQRTLMESIPCLCRPFTVVKLPMPTPVYFKDRRLPASYANFLITNKKVLVPVFGCREDEAALSILRELFPTRIVVGILSVDLVYGLGTLHCLSQQVPLV